MTASRRPWRGYAVLLVLLLGLGVLPFAGLVPDPLATEPGLVVTGIRARAPTHAQISAQVYGYLPYWQLDSTTATRLRYDVITTIALFGVGITASGDLDRTTPGYAAYLSANAIAVVNAAHAHGVRVVPTFQLFDAGNLSTMKAFLGSEPAQKKFITQALGLIATRRADGANIDFEPVPDSLAPQFTTFLKRFDTALDRQVSGATLVVAMNAGASGPTIKRIAPIVDALFVMAYDYRTTRSSSAGPVAPLDARYLSVHEDLARYVRNAPPSKVILGMPAYGYDWPVSDKQPGAAVRKDASAVGSAFSVSYASITRFLDLHPALKVGYDPIADSPYFTYHDHDTGTYRQVWFEDPRSLSRKIDLALTSRIAGVGIWALDDSPQFAPIWQLLHDKLRAPTHRVVVGGSLNHVRTQAGIVRADISATIQNRGTVPELGQLGWAVRDPKGHVVASGSVKVTVDSVGARRPAFHVTLGTPARLRSGTYRLTLVYGAGGRHWAAPTTTFRQPY
jgi:spore germination protein YaaH